MIANRLAIFVRALPGLLFLNCPGWSVDLSASEPALTANGWQSAAARAEIRPAFVSQAQGGRSGRGALIIEHDAREGLDGFWTKTFPVKGGQFYRFEAFRRCERIASARRSAVVRLLWRDERGNKVLRDPDASASSRYVTNVLHGYTPTVEAEHPLDRGTDAAGWTEVSDVYRAPAAATSIVVELHLQWAPLGKIEWSDVSLKPVAAPVGRKVRLAAVHFRPQAGKTPADKCRLFAPLIEEAARQRADLVVLPETLTYFGTGLSFADVAEPIPGPATDYFGELAAKHRLYIVAGLVEREKHLIYNVAVLIAPDGKVAGKYRKVCLPRDEVAAGIAPGHDYPVFETRFGKVGMMICYDGFFPEVARQLSNRGAEVIAWPVWGCNPILAGARACENHVYLVSSTYEDISRDWMLSAVWDHDGRTIARGKMGNGRGGGSRSRSTPALAQPGRFQSGPAASPARLSRHSAAASDDEERWTTPQPLLGADPCARGPAVVRPRGRQQRRDATPAVRGCKITLTSAGHRAVWCARSKNQKSLKARSSNASLYAIRQHQDLRRIR